VADGDFLVAGVGKRKKRARYRTAVFPTPPGATWEDVCLTVSDHEVRVEVEGKRRTLTFSQAGYEDRRGGNVPNQLWSLLRLFALHGGTIPFDSTSLTGPLRTGLKQSVTKLGRRLKELFQIEGSPFKDSRRTRRYESRFRISAGEGVRFPTPGGVGWDQVSIWETEHGSIAVSVDAHETFATLTPPSEEEGHGTWEHAQRSSSLRREYDLRTLGLAGEDGRLSAAGQALLAVLRAGGKVQREETDKGMVALGKRLTDLMEITSSPFQFSPGRKLWAALFDASSHNRSAGNK
jgi:hypothetical protein